MRLVCLAEGVEACLSHLFHTGGYLLVGEGMALSEDVFIVTRAVDEYRIAVKEELPCVVRVIHAM